MIGALACGGSHVDADNVRLQLMFVEEEKHWAPALSTGRIDSVADLLLLNVLHVRVMVPGCVSLCNPVNFTWVASKEDVQILQLSIAQWSSSDWMPIL